MGQTVMDPFRTWGLGFRGLGLRGLGFRGLGFRGLGLRVKGLAFLVVPGVFPPHLARTSPHCRVGSGQLPMHSRLSTQGVSA